QTGQPLRRCGERVERVPQLVSRAWPGAIPGHADDSRVLGHPILLSGALKLRLFLIINVLGSSQAGRTAAAGLPGDGEWAPCSRVGSVKLKQLPRPGALTTAPVPPCASTSCLASGNPIPAPPVERAHEGSAR